MIQLENVCKTYENEKNKQLHALQHIHLHVQKRDMFAVVGVSGAGKSTMMRLMGLLEPPTSGSIYLDGRDTSTLGKKARLAALRTIGTVFQGYHLLMQKTVFQNIAFPLQLIRTPKEEVQKRVRTLLSLVGLCDKETTYPSTLSGGQKQRVAIARALATNPKLLLCDEPTAALDPLSTAAVLRLLKEINETLGVTVVMITHNMDVVQKACNRFAFLHQGTLTQQGDVRTMGKNPYASAQGPLFAPVMKGNRSVG